MAPTRRRATTPSRSRPARASTLARPRERRLPLHAVQFDERLGDVEGHVLCDYVAQAATAARAIARGHAQVRGELLAELRVSAAHGRAPPVRRWLPPASRPVRCIPFPRTLWCPVVVTALTS